MTRAAFRKAWLPWSFAGLLAVLCAILAVVQHRWIDEISTAQRDRLHAVLQNSLNRLSAEFDQQIAASAADLKPSFEDITEWGTELACSRQYVRWRTMGEPVFSRIGIVNLEGSEPQLFLLDMNTGTFSAANWPAGWKDARTRFEARAANAPVVRPPAAESAILEFALFGSLHPGSPPRQRQVDFRPPPPPKEDWLVLELDVPYVRSTLLPGLMNKHVTEAGMPAFDTELVTAGAPANPRAKNADAAVGLLERSIAGNRRWLLQLYHRGYSMEDRVAKARLNNLALSGGILLLILTTVVVLLHNARKSEHLAGLQMNFVAGVSHELRTPLAVIRTAAFNLRGRLATRPEQVEKYGVLIQNESEKLSILVEQVLRYGEASAGRAIGARHAIRANHLIEAGLEASLAKTQPSDFTVTRRIDPNLPIILADELALKHALQNLVENAVKHGGGVNGWLGISAAAIGQGEGRMVEIRVADHGPGIPREEQEHLFDAFFRGKRALADQVHGTGLGLNLVKSIIEAHGGTIQVQSEIGQGAEFIVRLPAAAEESQDVFSNIAG